MSARQTVASDESGVPEGFVAMASFGRCGRGARSRVEYEWIVEAYNAGKIDAVKVMRTPRHRTGPVFVNEAQAHLILERRRMDSAAPSIAPAPADSSQAVAALVRIADCLDAIREALPRVSAPEWIAD